MKRVFVAILFMFIAGAAHAQTYRLGPIEVLQPWTRATPKGASVASGYMRVVNTGATADRLVAATFERARRVEIHEMSMAGGVMKMRALPAGLEIKAGETVELKPGSLHLMFLGLARPLVKDERVRGTLTFERAGMIEIEYLVGATGGGRAGPGH